MDGDHMNINPHAPQFSGAGPSGAALFFGRKWWYYNQVCNYYSCNNFDSLTTVVKS